MQIGLHGSEDNSTSSETKTGEGNTTASSTAANHTAEVIEIAGTNFLDYIGKNKVPFHFAKLTHYVITVLPANRAFIQNITVPGNMTEVNITDLPSSVEHKIIVSAVYLTNSTISAEAVTAKTAADPSKASNCYCDLFGTKDGYKSCNLSLTHVPWCECKPSHAGLFCEICAHGYNRTARSLPCHTCPCPETFSTGSCHFTEGYLHCTTYREVYTGNLCHRCANGYYRDHAAAPSKCIKCQGCHDITPGLIYDPFNAEKNTSTKPPAAGIIVVSTIVLLPGIVGFIVYKRSHNFPKNKPF